jgi:hypothetical protein
LDFQGNTFFALPALVDLQDLSRTREPA